MRLIKSCKVPLDCVAQENPTAVYCNYLNCLAINVKLVFCSSLYLDIITYVICSDDIQKNVCD